MSDRMRLAVFGLGIAGNQHAQHALTSPDFRLCAVAEPQEQILESWRGKKVACYSSSDELLREQQVDAVIVASPHKFHYPQTLAALRHGCHVMVEKPMAMSVRECDEMVLRARQRNRNLMVALTRHFLPAYRCAKGVIEAGRIGRPTMALDPFLAQYVTENRPKWYLQSDARGMFWNIGIHCIDRLRWLLHTSERSVAARITKYNDIDLGAAVLLDYYNGASATITMSGFSTSAPLPLHIIGDKGILRLALDSLELKTDLEFEPVDFPGQPDSRDLQLAEFAASIVENRAPDPDGRWGRDIIAVVEAVYQSSKTNKTVRPRLAGGEAR